MKKEMFLFANSDPCVTSEAAAAVNTSGDSLSTYSSKSLSKQSGMSCHAIESHDVVL